MPNAGVVMVMETGGMPTIPYGLLKNMDRISGKRWIRDDINERLSKLTTK